MKVISKPRLNIGLLPVIFSALSVSLTAPANAADWICSGTENYGNSSCWTGGVEPGANEDALINVYDSSDVIVNYQGSSQAGSILSDFRLNNESTGNLIFNRYTNDVLNANLAIIGTNGNVTVNHSSGDSSINYMVMASSSTSVASYNLSGTGSISTTGIYVGNSGQAYMNQSGGTLNVTDEFSVGHQSGGYGSYTLSGGTINVAGAEYVGYFGDADFVQSGGVHNVNDLFVGRKNVTGTYTINSGDLNVTRLMDVGTIPGAVGSTSQNASFVQNGGNLTLNPGGIITVSSSGMAEGSYQLNAGTVTADTIVNNDTFDYQGGGINANIDNRDQFNVSGGGSLSINGDFINRGLTEFQHTFAFGTPDETEITRTATSSLNMNDGTTLSINGDAYLQPDSTISIDLASGYLSDSNPWLSVDGIAYIDGVLDLSGIYESILFSGDTWSLLEASIVYGEFTNVIFPEYEGIMWDISYNADSIMLSGIASVPLPSAFWLLGSGLLGLISVGRRSKKV